MMKFLHRHLRHHQPLHHRHHHRHHHRQLHRQRHHRHRHRQHLRRRHKFQIIINIKNFIVVVKLLITVVITSFALILSMLHAVYE